MYYCLLFFFFFFKFPPHRWWDNDVANLNFKMLDSKLNRREERERERDPTVWSLIPVGLTQKPTSFFFFFFFLTRWGVFLWKSSFFVSFLCIDGWMLLLTFVLIHRARKKGRCKEGNSYVFSYLIKRFPYSFLNNNWALPQLPVCYD
jgi:hypothetical protein